MELFRGSERVYALETVRPEASVPASWTVDGELRRLTPGEYRWYVWAVVDGRRQAKAVVQTTLVIPSG